MLGVATGGENDAGQRLEPVLVAHLPEHVEPAQLRHHQIEHGEIYPVVAVDEVQSFLAVVRETDPKWTLLELHLDDAADVRLVIGDEHMTETVRGIAHAQISEAMLPR